MVPLRLIAASGDEVRPPGSAEAVEHFLQELDQVEAALEDIGPLRAGRSDDDARPIRGDRAAEEVVGSRVGETSVFSAAYDPPDCRRYSAKSPACDIPSTEAPDRPTASSVPLRARH